MKGLCEGCGELVEDEGGYHSAHAPMDTHRGDGECLECPVQCGPVVPDNPVQGEKLN